VPDVGDLERVIGRHRQLGVPAHEPPEHADLVDGLWGAAVAQLGWPVGCQQDERHACGIRLDRRREEVRCGAAGGDQDRGRAAARLGQAQRHEAGPPLVEVDEDAQVRVCRERERHRCGP
jgi:hypothetical protein